MKNKSSGGLFLLNLLVLAIAASGCGKSSTPITKANAVQHNEPAHATVPAPAGNLTPASDLGMMNPATLNELMGNYSATFQGWTVNGDAFSTNAAINLTLTTTGNIKAAQMTFQTSGGDEPLVLAASSWTAPALIGMPANGGLIYSLVSQRVNLPAISQYDVVFEMILTVDLNNKFDPKHSAIFIKECWSPQSVVCNSDLQDVWFLDDLGRRN